MCDPISIGGTILSAMVSNPTATIAGASMLSGVVQGNMNRDAQNRAMEEYSRSAQQQTGEVSKANEYFRPYAEAGQYGLGLYKKYLETPVEESPYFQSKARLLKQRMAATGDTMSGSANSQGYIDLMRAEESDRLNRLVPLISAGQYGASNIGQTGRSLASIYAGEGQVRSNYMTSSVPQYGEMFGQAAGLYSGLKEQDELGQLRRSYLLSQWQ